MRDAFTGSRWTARRIAFTAWTATQVVVFGFGFFGLTSLALAWFQAPEGVAGPVTELGYGALVGIILTAGVATQLHAPERHIAGIQRLTLVTLDCGPFDIASSVGEAGGAVFSPRVLGLRGQLLGVLGLHPVLPRACVPRADDFRLGAG